MEDFFFIIEDLLYLVAGDLSPVTCHVYLFQPGWEGIDYFKTFKSNLFNRPSVAGPVLKTPLSHN